MLNKIKIGNGNEFIAGKVLAYNSFFKTWSIEHFSKCSFRCAYCCCDSQGNSIATVDPETLIETLKSDMHQANSTGLFFEKKTKILLSCHTDPYIDLESEFLLTRNIIRYLSEVNQPFSIITRGVLIQRDLDLLTAFKEHCDISFSLPIIDPHYIKKFEPHVPAIEERIKTIWAVHEAGLDITVRIDPWVPSATDVEAILRILPKNIDVLISPLMLSEVFKIGGAVDKFNEVDGLLSQKYAGFVKNGFCKTATKLFANLSQNDINNEYIKERNRIGFRSKVKWFYPPSTDGNFNEVAYRFLKPNELLPSS